ncbi:MAG: hypothetical protein WCD16_01825 [Paracoccaceae bacterium]
MQLSAQQLSAEPTFAQKVAFLSDPAAYTPAPGAVEVVETHMSVVFLAGDRVFKIKKPVRYDFLDFSTIERRAAVVRDEIRLNRRLAPDVYIGTQSLRVGPRGSLALDGEGPVVDWLVEMHRLPGDRMLVPMIASGQVTQDDVLRLGKRLTAFYGDLSGEPVSPADHIGRFETEQALTATVLTDPRFGFDGKTVTAALEACDAALDAARPHLEDRVRQGRIVEGHGDLRPEHVFLTDPPAIIDCLEFNRRLRLVDPFDEIAFLGLECALLGADNVFPTLLGQLSEALDDLPPQPVLEFYWRYRALLRARLALLHLAEPKPRKPGKWRPLAWCYVWLAAEAGLRTRLPEDR